MTLLTMKPPEEITYVEVVTFWERAREALWSHNYTVWISPNRDLRMWTNDIMCCIALMYCPHTGRVHQVRTEALYELMKELGVRI